MKFSGGVKTFSRRVEKIFGEGEFFREVEIFPGGV